MAAGDYYDGAFTLLPDATGAVFIMRPDGHLDRVRTTQTQDEQDAAIALNQANINRRFPRQVAVEIMAAINDSTALMTTAQVAAIEAWLSDGKEVQTAAYDPTLQRLTITSSLAPLVQNVTQLVPKAQPITTDFVPPTDSAPGVAGALPVMPQLPGGRTAGEYAVGADGLPKELHAPLTLKAGTPTTVAEITAQELDIKVPPPETKDAVATALSTKAVESQGLRTELDARELLVNKSTVLPADGVAGDTKYPTDKAVRDALLAEANQYASTAEVQAATDTEKIVNTVELKVALDEKVNTADKAATSDVGAKTADKWLSSEHMGNNAELDGTDTIARESDIKAYVDRRNRMLEADGWVKDTGILAEAGARRWKVVGALDFIRWDVAANNYQEFSYAAADPISFRVADRNGYVTTGLGAEDLSAPVDQIEQSWGYDNNGTLESIPAFGGDGSDGVVYRVYAIPQTGEYVVLLPQEVEASVNNAFYRYADEQFTIPAILNGAVMIGYSVLDENATNFSYTNAQGKFPGQTTSSNAAIDQAYQFAADPNTLTAAQMTENGAVGTVEDGEYVEYRVRTIGADWATSIKSRITGMSGQLSDFDDVAQKAIPKEWKAEDLDAKFTTDVLFPGNTGALIEKRQNVYFQDQTIGAEPTATAGNWYEVGVLADDVADYDPLAPPPVVMTRYVSVEDPAAPGTFTWSEQGESSKGGDTIHIFHANERLEVIYFTLNDRRDAFKDTRQQRFALTVDELTSGNATWTADHANASGSYTNRLIATLNLGGASYDFRIEWKQTAGEYEFRVYDRHAGRWSTYGAISSIVYKYAATDPPKPVWDSTVSTTSGYATGSVVIGKAPAGVAETADSWFIGEAQSDRPTTVTTLDATEWPNWTWTAFVPTKQDIVKTFYAARPDPATLLTGSTVRVTNNTVDPTKNGTYTVLGPVGGAGTGYSADPVHVNRIALPVSNKPRANQFHLIAGATTLDGADVLAGGTESYYFEVPPNTALTVPGVATPITHAGPNNETVHLMPHPANAGEFVVKNRNASNASGLRGVPVADAAALTGLTARNYERRKRLDDGSEWVFDLGRTPATGDLADDATTGAWVNQTLTPGDSVAPSLMVGNRWMWNRTDPVPDHLLPLNGQTIANADVDFPVLWSVKDASSLIASSDDTAKTITLKDYNGQGRFARAGATAGVEQSDATAVNGLRTFRTYVQADWNGQSNNDFGKGSGSGTGAANNSVGMSSSDTETRPINVSEIWCIIAKPWVVSGDVTINQNAGDHTSRTAGDGSAGTIDTHTIWQDAAETVALGTFTVLNGATGAVSTVPGPQGTSVDHISRTTGDGSPGTTDTYTVWADAGETTALGTYDVTIPGTTAIITPRQLVVTSPTATPDITIFEEQPNRYVVNVTTGKRLVLGAVVDATIELVSAKYGTIVAQATGPNPTVTFTEEDVPAVPDKVGNREVWNRTDAIPSNWLALNGQVVATADVSYPELWAIRSLSTLIQSFDDTAKTITLKNYNGQGRFARASNTPGTEQNDGTAVNGLRTFRTYVQSDWNGQSNNDFGKGSGSGTGAANNSVGMSSSDPETRPINFSESWCVVAEG